MASRLVFGMTCDVGIRPLRKLFWILYNIASVKDASLVVQLELSSSDSLKWNVNFIF
jgi:hypothetical protein